MASETRVIPDNIIEFINERASAAFFSTGGADNRPRMYRLHGFRVDESGTCVRALFPHYSLTGLAEALAANERAAVAMNHTLSHECYQVKGAASPPEAPTEADLAHFALALERGVEMGKTMGFPEELIRKMISPPVRVVSVEVDHLFVQTPGPGAGARLDEGKAS